MDKFTFTSGDFSIEVLPAGLSKVKLGSKVIADGALKPWFYDDWYVDEVEAPNPTPIDYARAPAPKLARKSAKRCEIRRLFPWYSTRETYEFFPSPTKDTVDILVTMYITNLSPTTIQVPGMGDFYLRFREPPKGYWSWQHYTYFQAPGGIRRAHPGDWQLLGGSYAHDDVFGFGTSPRTPATPHPPRSLTLYYFVDWDERSGQLHDGPKQIIHQVHTPIPPQSTVPISFLMRFSTRTDWKHLLTPYKQFYSANWVPKGGLQYFPLKKGQWILQDHCNRDVVNNPDFPEGYQQGRMIATKEGTDEWLAYNLEKILKSDPNCAGTLIWSITGTEPSIQPVYINPAFNVMQSPRTQANWERLWQAVSQAGKRNGIATRPGDEIVPLGIKQRTTLRVSAQEESARALVWSRFKWALDRGVDLFYVDSIGNTLEDLHWVKFLRQQLNTHAIQALTFIENPSDVVLPYSALYAEVRCDPDGHPVVNRWGNHLMDIWQWLCPGMQVLARDIPANWDGSTPAADKVENFQRNIREFFDARNFSHLLFNYEWHLNGQKEWRY